MAIATRAVDLSSVPSAPGAYAFLDRADRLLYIGRAGDLRDRVRSYWHASLDRPGLRGMVRRIRRVVTVTAASEHEGALIERALIERYDPPFNRIYGNESVVAIRLSDTGLQTVHEFAPAADARLFGPYLGWTPVSSAARARARAYPVHLTRTDLGSVQRDIARRRGVAGMTGLRERLIAALERDGGVIDEVVRQTEIARDRASELGMYEQAAAHQSEIAGLRWIAQPQSAASFTAAGGWRVMESRLPVF